MAYLNGRLPSSVLAPIPGGHLRRDAAASVNAMNVEMRRRYGTYVYCPNARAYRTLAEQWSIWRRARPGMAAYPGRSNHGLGIAIDAAPVAHRIRTIGAKYGWSKRCSDAAHEYWHFKFAPACTGANFKPVKPKRRYPTITKRNGHGHREAVRLIQRILHHLGYKSVDLNGKYDITTRRAVKKFQRRVGLRADGVCGERTWRRLLRHRPK